MGKKKQSGANSSNRGTRKVSLSTKQKELQGYVDKLLRLSTASQQHNLQQELEHHKEIAFLINQITKIENKNVKPTENKRDENIDRFVSWVKDNGGIFNGCAISEFPGYDLGIKCTNKIPQNTLVIAIPTKIMLTVEKAKNGILKAMLENDQILKNMSNVALAISLLVEKYTEESFYKPYIDVLPKAYSTVLYFSVDELEELKGSPTLESALKCIKSIARQYAYFQTIFTHSNDPVSELLREHFTYEEYRWAVSTVMTRQNTIPSNDGSTFINALIPLWDMCNHTNGNITTDFNPSLDRSECLALKNYEEGEQLFIFYGARSNADLFIHNGFVYEDNEHDYYPIRFGISKSDSLADKRINLLNKLSIANASDFYLRKGGNIDGKLLAFLRVFNMHQEQLNFWSESAKITDLEHIDCSLETSLEKKCWQFLQARLTLLLSTYKTTLAEDKILIKELIKDNKNSNRVLAIRMRATEKTIITEALEHAKQLIDQ